MGALLRVSLLQRYASGASWRSSHANRQYELSTQSFVAHTMNGLCWIVVKRRSFGNVYLRRDVRHVMLLCGCP